MKTYKLVDINDYIKLAKPGYISKDFKIRKALKLTNEDGSFIAWVAPKNDI